MKCKKKTDDTCLKTWNWNEKIKDKNDHQFVICAYFARKTLFEKNIKSIFIFLLWVIFEGIKP